MNKKRSPDQFLKIISFTILLLIGQNSTQAQSKPWKVPEAAENVRNPLANNTVSTRKGKTLFKSNCAPCHGVKGKGNGPSISSRDTATG